MKSLKRKVKFNPFNVDERMNWNLWYPTRTEQDLAHLPENGRICLMLDRKFGRIYMKKAEECDLLEWLHGSGYDAVIAVAHENECFE